MRSSREYVYDKGMVGKLFVGPRMAPKESNSLPTSPKKTAMNGSASPLRAPSPSRDSGFNSSSNSASVANSASNSTSSSGSMAATRFLSPARNRANGSYEGANQSRDNSIKDDSSSTSSVKSHVGFASRIGFSSPLRRVQSPARTPPGPTPEARSASQPRQRPNGSIMAVQSEQKFIPGEESYYQGLNFDGKSSEILPAVGTPPRQQQKKELNPKEDEEAPWGPETTQRRTKQLEGTQKLPASATSSQKAGTWSHPLPPRPAQQSPMLTSASDSLTQISPPSTPSKSALRQLANPESIPLSAPRTPVPTQAQPEAQPQAPTSLQAPSPGQGPVPTEFAPTSIPDFSLSIVPRVDRGAKGGARGGEESDLALELRRSQSESSNHLKASVLALQETVEGLVGTLQQLVKVQQVQSQGLAVAKKNQEKSREYGEEFEDRQLAALERLRLEVKKMGEGFRAGISELTLMVKIKDEQQLARLFNLASTDDCDTLQPLPTDSGFVPPNFPMSRVGFEKLSYEGVAKLVEQYGLPMEPSKNRHDRLARFVGLR